MILAVVQARMSSARLPGKVMKRVLDRPLIGYLLERLMLSRSVDRIILATSLDPSNDPLCEYVESKRIEVFRGAEEDVLDRYHQAASKNKADVIVRITGDCPLIDYRVVDRVVGFYKANNFDYVSNIAPPTFPDGMDVEVFSFASLERAWREARPSSEREHVTLYIRNSGKFKIGNVVSEIDLSNERWTVDNEEDFELVKDIIANLYKGNPAFSIEDILKYKKNNPQIFSVNQHIKRNEGLKRSLRKEAYHGN